MKKILFLFALLILASAVFAQTGMKGLYFGEDINTAHKHLLSQGYILIYNIDVLRKYGKDTSFDAYMIDLIYDTTTKCLAGWSIYYDRSMSSVRQMQIVNDYIKLHGDNYTYNETARMGTWFLGGSRTCNLGFDAQDNLGVAVYYDESKTSLFDRSDVQNDRWKALNK